MTERDETGCDEVFACAACGDEADGTSECNYCGSILCHNCATEYEECCELCYEAWDADQEAPSDEAE